MCRGRGLSLLKRKFRISGWMMLVAVAMLTAYDSGGGSTAKATSSECTTGNLFTLVNNNKYPIWLGEFAGDPAKIVVPPMGNWKMEAGSTVDLK